MTATNTRKNISLNKLKSIIIINRDGLSQIEVLTTETPPATFLFRL